MNIALLIILFLLSGIISFFLLKIGMHFWRKWKILDRPHLYKSEQWRDPAPYWMGIVIFLIILILSPIIFIFWDFSPLLEKRLFIILIIGAFLSVISFIDDMDTIAKSPIKVPPIIRLGMQVLVGAIVGITSIKISYISNIFWGILSLDDIAFQFEIWGYHIYILPVLITIFWYVLIFNAVNFSDGVPGITGGFAFISFITLGILAIKLFLIDTTFASQENSRFILTLIAILLPVTFFITKADIKREIIMGDSWTIMLAFCIATLAIIAGGKIATTVSVLWMYVIDLIFVVMMRIKRWQNPMKGDQDSHLHFRLMEIWLSKNQVRSIIYFLTAIFGISAIFLSTHGKIILFIIIAWITIFLTEILSAVQIQEKTSKKHSS